MTAAKCAHYPWYKRYVPCKEKSHENSSLQYFSIFIQSLKVSETFSSSYVLSVTTSTKHAQTHSLRTKRIIFQVSRKFILSIYVFVHFACRICDKGIFPSKNAIVFSSISHIVTATKSLKIWRCLWIVDVYDCPDVLYGAAPYFLSARHHLW